LKLTREIKTGILVISAILLFIWGYSFIKGKNIFSNYKTIYVQYDNIEGIVKSAPVTINGLAVGTVTNITLNSTTGKILVELQLKTDFPISKSSRAAIYEPGFIVGKQIAIYPNFDDKSIVEEGDFLQGEITAGLTASLKEKLVPLQEKFEKLLLNVDQLVSGFNTILDAKGQADLKNSLTELNKTITEFHKASANVNTILDDNKSQIKVQMWGEVSNLALVEVGG
jgi:phospholipid/cholesterol/gamma-HCH transport system substrate-binding protein